MYAEGTTSGVGAASCELVPTPTPTPTPTPSPTPTPTPSPTPTPISPSPTPLVAPGGVAAGVAVSAVAVMVLAVSAGAGTLAAAAGSAAPVGGDGGTYGAHAIFYMQSVAQLGMLAVTNGPAVPSWYAGFTGGFAWTVGAIPLAGAPALATALDPAAPRTGGSGGGGAGRVLLTLDSLRTASAGCASVAVYTAAHGTAVVLTWFA